MSTTRTVYLTHAAGIRSRAFALFRQCWKPILLAAVITGVFALISSVLSYRGTQLGAAASEAALAEFYAEAPAEGTTEYIEWAYFNEHAMEEEADKAASRASLPWEAASVGVDVLGWIVGTFVMLGLNRGLLRALRGGECMASDLLDGRRGYRRALWTDVVVFLRVLGYILLAGLAMGLLSAALGGVGTVIGAIGMLIFAVWLAMRYMLVELHVADDAEGAFSASDFIRSSVEDVKYFSIWRIIGVLWPFWLAGLAFGLPSVLAELVPSMGIAVMITDLVYALLAGVLTPVLTVCIYEAIRYELNDRLHENDGAARARALAAGEDE